MQTGSTPDIPAQVEEIDGKLSEADGTSISLNGDFRTTKEVLIFEKPSLVANPEVEQSHNEKLLSAIKASSELSSTTNSPTPSTSSTTIGKEERRECEMCKNYETSLQEIQYRERLLIHQAKSDELTIKRLKEDLKNEQRFCENLEEKYTEEQERMEGEIKTLSTCIDDSQKTISQLAQQYDNFENRTNDIITGLIEQAGNLGRELDRVKTDNDVLLGKNLITSQQMLAEEIWIPQNSEELQLYCLKLREDLISVLVQKEESVQKLSSENLFLKQQLQSEQSTKDQLMENYSLENENLRLQLEKMKNDYIELRKHNQKSEKEYLMLKEKYQATRELELQVKELSAFKTKAEADLSHLRNKVSSLQVELENSEEVQRDFVKLSQSLQVQLEKIRQAKDNTEVRWQHEDDVAECSNCKRVFHSKKEKINCSHCGRIFCVDCCGKVFKCGPNNRPFRVCDVCHTLLDNQTACWFANQAPACPT